VKKLLDDLWLNSVWPVELKTIVCEESESELQTGIEEEIEKVNETYFSDTL